MSIPYWSVPNKKSKDGALNLGPLLISIGFLRKKGPNIAIDIIKVRKKYEGVFKNCDIILNGLVGIFICIFNTNNVLYSNYLVRGSTTKCNRSVKR